MSGCLRRYVFLCVILEQLKVVILVSVFKVNSSRFLNRSVAVIISLFVCFLPPFT